MTDKPLDCIGLDLATAWVGKHDFREYATTNACDQPAEFSKESLTKALEMLKAMPPEEELIDHARVGKDYLKMLERNCTGVQGPPVYGGRIGVLDGTKIILDENLPPDVCEFRNKDGKVLRTLRLEP
ncbi:hypothetical protein [Fimbriiglobus ruber]|uniref:Uncharacterized protein n=1 Tax=Fimbriiglobus ruber TaxID=1908690 RepID=A0A225D1M5_9BACT|nr:hypothetical protein [Fimbriiglobus ruber]OWK35481.1 hypothetical protein FRUB_08044 [Fimbriiglobus ruber]